MFAYSYAELVAKLSKKPNRTSVVRLNFAFLVRFVRLDTPELYLTYIILSYLRDWNYFDFLILSPSFLYDG